jgi:alanyl-tRNA synthetase
MTTVRELRQKYLTFFEGKGHARHASGSLVPFDVTGRLDESLLFNGAGMVQFKPYFRGIAEPPCRRLVNAQKCLRTGDIESVGDTSHLTFFEMLGNFSFGDYFKEDAIAYSWEFLTSPDWLGLDPNRLAFTVFEEDDEAFDLWAEHVRALGIDPGTRVFRLGEETNYWPAGAFSGGPPGPCGPNSEMFYWVPAGDPPSTKPGGYGREDYLRDEAEGRWLEIWNDVFIQFEWQGEPLPEGGYKKTGMPPLPFRSVDTGMGIERTVAVLSGSGSVYDTDAFQPLFRAIEKAGANSRYGIAEPTDRAMRVIADHLRSACFCVADGVLPSNTGRGYVLRRLLRRAVLKGQRTLGFSRPFLHELVTAVVENFGDHYVELTEKSALIVETLRSEEALFRRTLEEGSDILKSFLAQLPSPGAPLPGDQAFKLYDTFGFPIEVTRELCEEADVKVDEAGYRRAMAEAQERSRAADERESVYGGVVVGFVFETEEREGPTPTLFLGYVTTEAPARIVGAVPVVDDAGAASGPIALALDQTPFYAESGGQVSDHGEILLPDGTTLTVLEMVRQDGVYVHVVEEPGVAEWIRGRPKEEATGLLTERFFGQTVTARVDAARRAHIVRHHTATHLLHAALREKLGPHVTQAGSLVAPDHLRFDFTHGRALSPDDLRAVEDRVNSLVWSAVPVVVYENVPLADARAMGAMALFGEKYGDRVRVVQIGGMSPSEPSFSRELCGGVHVGNTGQIGLFKILHESSTASGVRRIEAVCGAKALDWAMGLDRTLHEAAAKLKSNPKDLVQAIEKTLDQLKEERKKRERLAQQRSSGPEVVHIGPIELVIEKLDGADQKDAQAVADRIVGPDSPKVALIASANDGKLVFVCKAGDHAVSLGAHAGNIVRAVAQVAGGGGGGKPDFATAGGRDPSKLEEALLAGRTALAGMLGA